MQPHLTPDAARMLRLATAELREGYLLENLFVPGRLDLVYTDLDRAIVGSAVPTTPPLTLGTSRELASEFFCQRRELGVLNIGPAGTVTVDGHAYTLQTRECLYIGRGSRQITFASLRPESPARFYLVSYPAHADHPTRHATFAEAEHVSLGQVRDANVRTIHKYIHPKGIASCQLVMGFTELAEGSIWNTMPPHTHARRSEVYLYFNIAPDACVIHLMGTPSETRHLIVRDSQAVLSPSWSLHAGAGTRAYSFIWAMGGENQEFTDMDPIDLKEFQ